MQDLKGGVTDVAGGGAGKLCHSEITLLSFVACSVSWAQRLRGEMLQRGQDSEMILQQVRFCFENGGVSQIILLFLTFISRF